MPGGKSARGRLANGSTKGLGEGNPLAGNDSTLLDTWLLPRGPAADPAARDDVPGSPARPTAAARSPQTPGISPRTPLVAREGIANPTVRPSRFSSANEELLAAYPSSPEAPSPQQMLHTSAPNAVALATIVAQPAPPQSSAQTGREREDSLATTSAGVPSASQDEASGQLPTTEGAIRAESSQRPLRRARRLTGDRASRKVSQSCPLICDNYCALHIAVPARVSRHLPARQHGLIICKVEPRVWQEQMTGHVCRPMSSCAKVPVSVPLGI